MICAFFLVTVRISCSGRNCTRHLLSVRVCGVFHAHTDGTYTVDVFSFFCLLGSRPMVDGVGR